LKNIFFYKWKIAYYILMINEERIKEMISDFAKLYNFNLEHLPSQAKDYSQWPNSFTGEEYEIALKIQDYVIEKNRAPNTRILTMGEFYKEKILEAILVNSFLQKA
jgi:hypothetical protein